jgi:hypothetical protein
VKSSRLTAILVILSTLLVCGCSAQSSQSVSINNNFSPRPATFDFHVTLFELNDNGLPQKLESGTVPIEKEIISALEAMGYTYAPGPEAKYIIEARLGSIDPKLAVLPEEQQIGLMSGIDWGIDDFNDYPVMVEEWSPDIQRIKSGPVACLTAVQLLIREQNDGKSRIVFQNFPHPHAASYTMGCPFSELSEEGIAQLKGSLLDIFAEKQSR